jgi:hypothetical protein
MSFCFQRQRWWQHRRRGLGTQADRVEQTEVVSFFTGGGGGGGSRGRRLLRRWWWWWCCCCCCCCCLLCVAAVPLARRCQRLERHRVHVPRLLAQGELGAQCLQLPQHLRRTDGGAGWCVHAQPGDITDMPAMPHSQGSQAPEEDLSAATTHGRLPPQRRCRPTPAAGCRHRRRCLLTRRARNALCTATQYTRGKDSPPPPPHPRAQPQLPAPGPRSTPAPLPALGSPAAAAALPCPRTAPGSGRR